MAAKPSMVPGKGLVFRREVEPADVEIVRSMTETTGFFSAEEVLIAGELVRERLEKGPESGYYFIFAQECPGEGQDSLVHTGCTGSTVQDMRAWRIIQAGGMEHTVQTGCSGPAGEIVGYTCFGPVPGTQSSFDLYWIVVRKDRRGSGIGRALLAQTEEAVASSGGSRLYAETSSRELYDPTRGFYCSAGFRQEAFLENFYAPGDGKIIFVKQIA
ncbi:MAG: GNAT family N-acetyltransferase [Desulfomonilia bacterium]